MAVGADRGHHQTRVPQPLAMHAGVVRFQIALVATAADLDLMFQENGRLRILDRHHPVNVLAMALGTVQRCPGPGLVPLASRMVNALAQAEQLFAVATAAGFHQAARMDLRQGILRGTHLMGGMARHAGSRLRAAGLS
jgi:hypothetical protein